jgi:2-polyprenyl-6-methoxyphenol hydroxylase-like FAD-dependent oxidoreductase
MGQSESIPIQNPDKFDVVISGGGPVALAAALEAIKAGKRVAIISDRDIDLSQTHPDEQKMVFSRGQRIFLDEQSRYYLIKMFTSDYGNNPDDVKFFEHLTQDITIRVRDIERFLFRRIDDERKKNTNTVEFLNRREVKSIDMAGTEGGSVKVGGSKKNSDAKERELTFNYMIGADGAAHHSSDVLNAGLKEKDTVKPPILSHFTTRVICV